jgi:hypothetical protein
MGRARSTTGEDELIYVIVGKPEGKRPLRSPIRKWVDNIKMDLGELHDCCI